MAAGEMRKYNGGAVKDLVTSFYFISLNPKVHDRKGFMCGQTALDGYVKTQATQDARRGYCACFVAATPEGRIAGYYTLSPYAIRVNDLPEATRKRLPAYPIVPAYLLGRLAVDTAFRGQGLGAALLGDALERVVMSEIPAHAVVVEAKNFEAANFYLHHGFLGFAGTTDRLFIPMATVRQALG